MKYFNSFPKILSTDSAGNSMVMTNLLKKSSMIQSIMNNPMLYYEYDIQEGDTPEIIAHKYYNDVYRYWIVLLANQIVDPQWDWPMPAAKFDDYLKSKYNTETYRLKSTLHHREMIETFIYKDSSQQVIKTYMNRNGYNNLQTGTKTLTVSDESFQVITDKRLVSIYQYEEELNESKRTIRLLNSSYVTEIETEFASLMSK